MRPFLQALVGDVRVVVTVRGRPSEADLEEHIAEAAVMMKTARVVFVVAGGDLTAQERGKMARRASSANPPRF